MIGIQLYNTEEETLFGVVVPYNQQHQDDRNLFDTELRITWEAFQNEYDLDQLIDIYDFENFHNNKANDPTNEFTTIQIDVLDLDFIQL